MKESKPLYGISDFKDFSGLIWETELGKIVVCHGDFDINSNLVIRSVETGEDIDVDLRNVFMSILPSK